MMGISEDVGLVHNLGGQSSSAEDDVAEERSRPSLFRMTLGALAFCATATFLVLAGLSQPRSLSILNTSGAGDVLQFTSCSTCERLTTCTTQLCELGVKYSENDFICSQSIHLTSGSCGMAGCVPRPSAVAGSQECVAPQYSKLDAYFADGGPYSWSCMYADAWINVSTCPPPSRPQCFAGKCVVDVLGRGRAWVNELRVGDYVQVGQHDGQSVYEPIIDFLHIVGNSTRTEMVALKHACGEMSTSSEHLIFVADSGNLRKVSKAIGDLREGDYLVDVTGNLSRVLLVGRTTGWSDGFFAPLTTSGTLIVGGALVSCYAGALGVRLPHGAMHAAFFSLRIYRMFVPSAQMRSDVTNDSDYIHPLVVFLVRTAGLLVLPAS